MMREGERVGDSFKSNMYERRRRRRDGSQRASEESGGAGSALVTRHGAETPLARSADSKVKI